MENKRPDCFLTDWEYEACLTSEPGKTYHLWSCQHKNDYIAWALTHQPADINLSYVKPMGSGHFVSLEALGETTGIDVSTVGQEVRFPKKSPKM